MTEREQIERGQPRSTGVFTPVPAARPLTDFSWEQIGDDLVILDGETMQYHTLNSVALRIWRSCDGIATVETIAVSTGLPADVVETSIAELGEASLLTTPANTWSVSMSRRRAAKLIAAGAVGAVGVPVVLSITAPSNASAATGLDPTCRGNDPCCLERTTGATCACTPGVYVYCVAQAGKRQCRPNGTVVCVGSNVQSAGFSSTSFEALPDDLEIPVGTASDCESDPLLCEEVDVQAAENFMTNSQTASGEQGDADNQGGGDNQVDADNQGGGDNQGDGDNQGGGDQSGGAQGDDTSGSSGGGSGLVDTSSGDEGTPADGANG